jgi:hypothetical protein
MSRRQEVRKPIYRYTVIDETINTWAVQDRATGKIVKGDFRSPMDARMYAEELNLNPPAEVDSED